MSTPRGSPSGDPPPDLEALRSQWRLLLEHPDRDDLAHELLAWLERDLDEADTFLRTGETVAARGRAIGQLVRDVLLLQHVRRRERVVEGPYWLALRARLGGPADIEDAEEAEPRDGPDADGSSDAADPADPFLAWTLSDLARDGTELERAERIERAIDAFDEIALLPRDPGNDAGPFTAIARLMDEPQVRRALSIARRMAQAEWGENQSRALQHLTVRLAALGHLDEAEKMLPEIADDAARTEALGQLCGERIVQRREWRSPLGDPSLADGRLLLDLLRGLTDVLQPPERAPPDALLRDLLARVRSEPDVSLRTGALVLMGVWLSVGDAVRWLSAIDAHAEGWLRVALLFDLGEVMPPSALRATVTQVGIARMLALDEHVLGLWLDPIYAVREALTLSEACALFGTVMTRAGRSRGWLVQDFGCCYDLVELLRWLGGECAIRETLGAIEQVLAFLGRAPE